MKLKEKLSREFSGSDSYVHETRLTPNQLNRDLSMIENAYLAGFEKAREMLLDNLYVLSRQELYECVKYLGEDEV